MRKLAIFAGGFVLAAALYVYLVLGKWAIWLAGGCLLCCLLCKCFSIRRVSILTLGLTVGFLWCMTYEQLWLAPVRTLGETEQTVTAELLSVPEPARWGERAEVRVELNNRSLTGMLYVNDTLEPYGPGDVVTCTARIAPSGFDFHKGEPLYAAAEGRHCSLYAHDLSLVERKGPSKPMALRLWLQKQIEHRYAGEAAAFLRALVTGDRNDLSYGLKTAFETTGVSHVIAVSGLHLSLLVTAVALLLFHNPRLTAFLGCPLIIMFALMTGASASVCRAAIMQIILLCAPLARRQYDPPTTLGTAALVLLLHNPWAIASVSFQLSFCAVAGILLLTNRITKKLLSLRKNPGKLHRAISVTIASTVAASVATLPLTILYFDMVPVISPLTNVLVLWAVQLILILGLLSLLLGPVGNLLVYPVRGLCAYVFFVCRTLAKFPYAAAYPANVPLMIWSIAMLLLLVGWLLSKRKRLHPMLVCAAALSLIVCVWTGRAELRSGTATILPEEKGQCLILQSGSFTAMVDCGGEDPRGTAEAASHFLRSAGITQIDALILTRLDQNHSGGAPFLLEQMQVGEIYVPASEPLEKGACRSVETPTKISVPGVSLTIYPAVFTEKSRGGGLSVLATAAEYDMLIITESNEMEQLRFLSHWNPPQVETLVVEPGKGGVLSPLLLEQTAPETVVCRPTETLQTISLHP